MGETRHTKVLIIGSGPAGYTAAVYSARAMLNPILVQGLQPGGQLTITTEVENWPGNTHIQGPDLMVNMQAHAESMGAEVISDYITRLDLQSRPFTAHGDSGGFPAFRWRFATLDLDATVAEIAGALAPVAIYALPLDDAMQHPAGPGGALLELAALPAALRDRLAEAHGMAGG